MLNLRAYVICALGLIVPTAAVSASSIGRVLPIGDSITQGLVDENEDGKGDDLNGDGFLNSSDNQYQSAWRLRFAERMVAAGVDYDFVGSKQNGYISPLPGGSNLPSWARAFPNNDIDHEGTGGFEIESLRNTILGTSSNPSNYLATYQPDTVIILAGINDLLDGDDVADTVNALVGLANGIINSPDHTVTNVYVSSLTPVFADADPSDDPFFEEVLIRPEIDRLNDDIMEFNDLLRQEFEDGGAFYSVTQIEFVDGFNAFTANNANLPDGLHPSSAAYDALGDVIADALLTTYSVVPEPAAAIPFLLLVLSLKRRRINAMV